MTAVEVPTGLSIGEIAAESGLSIHTLQYYERIGLIARIQRAPSGHRRYSVGTRELVEALSCYLRASGMSVEDTRTSRGSLELGAAAEHVRRRNC